MQREFPKICSEKELYTTKNSYLSTLCSFLKSMVEYRSSFSKANFFMHFADIKNRNSLHGEKFGRRQTCIHIALPKTSRRKRQNMRINREAGQSARNLSMSNNEQAAVSIGRRGRKKKTASENQIKNGRIFAGNLSVKNPIEAKRKEAQKKALKIVKDAFAKESEIDDSVENLKESAQKAEKEMFSAQEELNKIKERRAAVSADESLTKEEREAAYKELSEAEKFYERQRNNQAGIKDSAAEAVKGIKLSRLKSAPILSATKSAEKVMENAAKETVSMLYAEAKENLDEEIEKKVEETEEKKEKEKELQEKIEAMKAKKEEKEKDDNPEIDAITENNRHLLKTWQVKEDVQKELQSVAKQMKLSLEDLKGAAVDEEV